MVRYSDSADRNEVESKEKLGFLKSYHVLRKALDKNCKGRINFISVQQRNEIARILSTYKTIQNIRPRLEALGLDENDVNIIENLNFSKFGHLSIKACEKIIPQLEKGMTYNEACKAAGYDFHSHANTEKSRLLPPVPADNNEITSPVVRRAVSQTIKVVNAIIRKYGESPMYINIELARELSKSPDERNKLKRSMDENRKKNESIAERVREYKNGAPTGLDRVKLKLFDEQDGVCAYSLRQMSIERLFEPNYTEVDHIVPYSISFDDSYKNKVLVLTEENRNKGNRLPMQYLTGKRKDDFQVWVNNHVHDRHKKRLLLKESFTEEDEKNLKERALQDTKTVSVFMLNYINDHLLFAPSLTGRKKRVTAVNGAVTDYMRKRWGITKIRENGDLHHAVDAVVIACATDRMIQKVSRYSSWHECRYMRTENGSILIDPATGEVKQEFPYPWEHFRKELEARTANDPSKAIAALKLPFYLDDDAPKVHPLFVSRMPTRKVTGAAHKDTAKGAKVKDEGYAVTRRPLTALKLDKNGEIAGFYNPDGDRVLYEALKKQLAAYDGDGAKAFKERFFMTKRDGSVGTEVCKVKLLEPVTISVDVQGKTAIAANDSMVRIDIFKVEGDGYYFVPIYVADTLKEKLPSKACIKEKPYSQWKEMSDDDFIFSLYPNDLFKVTHKRAIKLTKTFAESTLPENLECKENLLYYRNADINTVSIGCFTNDNAYKVKSLGLKTLESIEKYEVDVLGEYHKVRKEKRQGFGKKRG